ncbi:MAG: hypothetical protein B6I20_05160 [Bacteroidetes bacterium 4572_117]|nr:MAG: hypothetical protein B6I20_05160 [Bacteroidetes bacterium 4572_117]
MKKELNESKNTKLLYCLLEVLSEKYACASDIKQKLESQDIKYQGKDFFPVLSHLLLKKYLCYNWISKSGKLVKYYHLTRNGDSFLKNNIN